MLNLVERFGLLTDGQFPWGFTSVKGWILFGHLQEFIDTHNESGKPFVWTKTSEEILLNSWACDEQRWQIFNV